MGGLLAVWMGVGLWALPGAPVMLAQAAAAQAADPRDLDEPAPRDARKADPGGAEDGAAPADDPQDEDAEADDLEDEKPAKKKKAKASGGGGGLSPAVAGGLGWAVGFLCGCVGCVVTEVVVGFVLSVLSTLTYVVIYGAFIACYVCLLAGSSGGALMGLRGVAQPTGDGGAAWLLALLPAGMVAAVAAPLLAGGIQGGLLGGAVAALRSTSVGRALLRAAVPVQNGNLVAEVDEPTRATR